MIRFYLLILMLMFISCDSLRQQEDRLSEDFITPSFSISFYASNGSIKYDSITVQWFTIEPKDENGRSIYPKAINTMVDCYGRQKTIVAGNNSYPSPFRIDDCPNDEFVFKLINSVGDSIVYRIPFEFDSSFYAQNFDFINGGIYKKHKDLFGFDACDRESIGVGYNTTNQLVNYSYKYTLNKNVFTIPSVDTIASQLNINKSSLNDIESVAQSCTNDSLVGKQGQVYFISYRYFYIFK